ncbi:MAG TPA: c-type cytochrome [Vicinamibacterales bacterium]|nr:c-type cytochrome [Vicinamibacterales bacterium]
MQQLRITPARAVSVSLTAFICLATFTVVSREARAQRAGAGAASGSPGKAVYDRHCVECHGADGKGDGPAAMTLVPHPRDFTSGRYKIRSTETGSLPTDDDLRRSVRKGLPGSAMPGWEGLLQEDDISAVVQYIKTLSPRFAAEQPDVIAASTPVLPSPDSSTRGAAVYAKLQCSKCHGEDGRGSGATATSFQDDWGYPLRAADLSEPWTFHGGPEPADVFMRFRAGISGTPMPSYTGAASDAEMWDLANYVAAMRRKPVWEMNAGEIAAFYKQQEAEALANPVKRGEYLVNILACPICHSPVDEQRRTLPGMRLAGGLRMQLAPFGVYPTGNLTSDKETGLGNWTDDEIKRVITKGTLRDGTRLLPFPMDWPSFSTMKPSDIDAVVAYLRTVPPVRNKVPRLSRTVLPLYLWYKFQMLIMGADLPSYFYSGNAGITSGARR